MFAMKLCSCRMDLELTALTPLFVGGGGPENGQRTLRQGRVEAPKRRDGVSYAVESWDERDAHEGRVAVSAHRYNPQTGVVEFVIPPSSLRGVLRSSLSGILERAYGLAGSEAWVGRWAQDTAPRTENDDGKAEDAEERARRIRDQGPPVVCQLFGTTLRRGLVSVEGGLRVAPPKGSSRDMGTAARYSNAAVPMPGEPRYEGVLRFISQNRLDRITMASDLRNFFAVDAGAKFAATLHVHNFSWAAVGLLALAIQEWTDRSSHVGGRTSGGLGAVEPRVRQLRIAYSRAAGPCLPEGDGEGNWPGVGALVAGLGIRPGRLHAGEIGSPGGTEDGLWCLDADDRIAAKFACENQEKDPFVAVVATVEGDAEVRSVLEKTVKRAIPVVEATYSRSEGRLP